MKKSLLFRISQVLLKQKAVLAILFLAVLMLFFDTNFYTAYNWLSMLRSAAVLEIVGFGVTMTVLCAGCDLSVGSTMCLSGVIAVLMLNAGCSMLWAILAGVLSGAVVGFVNGFFVVHQRTEPFIITLGMGVLLKGVCQQLTDAHPLACENMAFMQLANAKLGQVPVLVIYMLILLAVFYGIVRYTGFGRNLYAVGGSYEVAQYSGINALRTKWIAFVVSGTAAALAGILLSSRMNTASSVYGDNTGMLVNCGVVVGGTSFAGGVGGMIESFVGIFILQMMTNCMDCLGIGAYVQQLLQGIVIVLILGFDCYTQMRKKERI